MKKFIAILLAALLLVTPFSLCASAETNVEKAYGLILSGILSCDEMIDIARYRITYEEFYTILNDISSKEAMIFNVSGAYSYYQMGDYVSAVLPEYVMTASEYATALEYVNGEIEDILALIPAGLSDMEKALFLHDYLCVNFQYDLTYQIHDIYTMLCNETAVCMGYALLYGELLNRIGIDNEPVNSPETSINHMWNEIKLDGEWYHVDCTWDDPVADRFGKASHVYFLLCDDCAKSKHENCEYYAANSCNDKTYETVEWRWVDSQFAFIKGTIYALQTNRIVEIDLNSTEVAVVEYVHSSGWVGSNGASLGYKGGFGGYNELLYYNTADAIFAYDVESDESYEIHNPDGIIIGLYMNGADVHYLVSESGASDDGIEYILTVDGIAPDVTPEVSEPETSEEESSVPEVSEPETSEEESSVPEASEPETSEEESSVPEASESETSEEESSVPEASEPETSEEESSVPEISEPETSEEESSVPEVSEPETSEGDTSEDEGDGETEDYVGGDANGDGVLDQFDYIIAKRIYFGTLAVTDEQRARADVNRDGVNDQFDYILIKRAYFGTYFFEKTKQLK